MGIQRKMEKWRGSAASTSLSTLLTKTLHCDSLFRYPSCRTKLRFLANALLPYSESAAFQPCLVWMTDWGIWSEVSERVAKSLAESFRSARGERNPLIDTPAHLFGETEAADAQTLLTIAIVFGWDCYVIPEHGKYYALTSHDEYLEVVCQSTALHQRFKEELEHWYRAERSR